MFSRLQQSGAGPEGFATTCSLVNVSCADANAASRRQTTRYARRSQHPTALRASTFESLTTRQQALSCSPVSRVTQQRQVLAQSGLNTKYMGMY